MAKGQIKQAQAKINQKEFEEMCKIQCTREEICAVFGVDDNTLIRWCQNTYGKDFGTVFQEKRLGGKKSLRRRQWELAGTNPTMSIWLGKQYLGQKEPQQEIKHSGEINNTFINAINDASKEVWKDDKGE